jgi:Ran GTPase-activating protein (RanGAP) involved in mRNA processing and transport
LTELDLSDNLIGNDGVEILANNISKNSLMSLKRLNLTNCKIDFTGFYKLMLDIQNNKKLEVLIMNKNNLNSEKFEQLRSIINISNIRELRLAKCKIGNIGGKFIINII